MTYEVMGFYERSIEHHNSMELKSGVHHENLAIYLEAFSGYDFNDGIRGYQICFGVAYSSVNRALSALTSSRSPDRRKPEFDALLEALTLAGAIIRYGDELKAEFDQPNWTKVVDSLMAKFRKKATPSS